MSKTNYQQMIEDRLGTSIERKLLECVEAEMTDQEIADAIRVPLATAKSWRRKYVVIERSCRLREPVAAGS